MLEKPPIAAMPFGELLEIAQRYTVPLHLQHDALVGLISDSLIAMEREANLHGEVHTLQPYMVPPRVVGEAFLFDTNVAYTNGELNGLTPSGLFGKFWDILEDIKLTSPAELSVEAELLQNNVHLVATAVTSYHVPLLDVHDACTSILAAKEILQRRLSALYN